MIFFQHLFLIGLSKVKWLKNFLLVLTVFSCNEMDILSIDLNNINLDDTNYDEDDPETIIYIRLLAWHIKFEKRKALKNTVT